MSKKPQSVEMLEDRNKSPREIVNYLINSAVNRKLEISEIKYLMEYLDNVDIPVSLEKISCSPCRNIDDLIYRLLELPSEQEIEDEIESYLQKNSLEQELTPISTGLSVIELAMKHIYSYVVGKLKQE